MAHLLAGTNQSVSYWRRGGKPHEFPELSGGKYGLPHIQKKPNFGVAIGGGGYRAATLASGWIRGLHKIPHPDGQGTVLSKTKYLSTISGSSWFNAPFSYVNEEATGVLASGAKSKDAESFLGPFYPPDKLVVVAEGAAASEGQLDVNAAPSEGSFDHFVAMHNTIDKFMRDLVKENAPGSKILENLSFLDKIRSPGEDDKVLPWTDAIRTGFLEPYGLHDMDSTICAEFTVGGIAGRMKELVKGPVFMACVDKDRPYPIMIGAAFNTPGSDGISFYPYEFTPLYVGTPTAFDESDPALGGGYVDPLGLNTVPLGPLKDAPTDTDVSGEVEVKVKHVVPLCQMVSISSSFFAAGAHAESKRMQQLASTEELVNWGLFNSDPAEAAAAPGAADAALAAGPTPNAGSAGVAAAPAAAAPGAPVFKQMGFADGGTVDNLGMMPLLRRKVAHIVVCVAAEQPADQDWETYAKENCDIASYFGVAKSTYIPKVLPVQWNDNAHVFGKDQLEGEKLFRELFQHMHSQLRSGGAPYYRAQYTVKDNRFHNIEGGWQVDVLWVINQQAKGWEKQLPKATRQKLETERKGEVNANTVVPREDAVEGLWHSGWGRVNTLHRFPYFTTLSLDYGNAPTNMLSQLATWVMVQAEGEIQDMMKKAGAAPVGPPAA